MRGAPHNGFSALIRRISARSSAIFGRLQESGISNASTDGSQLDALGPDDRDGLEDRWKPSIQLDQEKAILRS